MKAQDEDRFGIGRSCSIVTGICRTVAADAGGLPASFAVH
jgi:hypothetical protein